MGAAWNPLNKVPCKEIAFGNGEFEFCWTNHDAVKCSAPITSDFQNPFRGSTNHIGDFGQSPVILAVTKVKANFYIYISHTAYMIKSAFIKKSCLYKY